MGGVVMSAHQPDRSSCGCEGGRGGGREWWRPSVAYRHDACVLASGGAHECRGALQVGDAVAYEAGGWGSRVHPVKPHNRMDCR